MGKDPAILAEVVLDQPIAAKSGIQILTCTCE